MKKLLAALRYMVVFCLGVLFTIAVVTVYKNDGKPAETQEDFAKLGELQALIEERFIGDVEKSALEDGAAAGMIAALDDEWSYYLSAADYESYMDQMRNAYVGVGITIAVREDGYLDVMKVEKGGPAEEAGILVGDILLEADGQDCAKLGLNGTSSVVKGEENTTVELTVLREEEELTISVERRYFEVVVADYEMLEDNIGLVSIFNFDDRCADETIGAVETLLDQGAEKLIFDVRNNPGGYQHELVEILDYLLPAGKLFTSEYYNGEVIVDESDADCLQIPMAVLINSESYSAAEFFAAALSEYDAAITVGQQTYGKGYFQQTFQLEDGSAVGLSVGKYYTPKGENLAGVGITPDVEVDVDDETVIQIYYGNLPVEEDPQISAAIDALKSEN